LQHLLVLEILGDHGPGAEQARFAGPLPVGLGTSRDGDVTGLNIALRKETGKGKICVGDVSVLMERWLETIGEAKGLLKHSADPMGCHPVVSLVRGHSVASSMRMASRYPLII
jgi:hypothetical protein